VDAQECGLVDSEQGPGRKDQVKGDKRKRTSPNSQMKSGKGKGGGENKGERKVKWDKKEGGRGGPGKEERLTIGPGVY